MVYVYDVLVNFNERLIDFYDWEEDDDYFHVRRCPLFKVSTFVIRDFSYRKVKVNTLFLNNIKDKTQMFSSKNIEVVPYMAIFSDSKSAVSVIFDKCGNIVKVSKFLINEELEIISLTNGLSVTNIDYKVSGKVRFNKMIRREASILDSIIFELSNIKDDKEKIDYLYYEWFDKSEGSNKYDTLVRDLKKRFTFRHEEFLNLINLLTVKK